MALTRTPSNLGLARFQWLSVCALVGLVVPAGSAAWSQTAAPATQSIPSEPASALRFHNVTLATGDLAHMTAWYVATLGFVVEEAGRFDAVGADYVMLTRQGIRLEFVCRRGQATRAVDRTDPPGHLDVLGWKALVLETNDLPALTARFRERGVELVWADQQISADRRSTMIRDPEGNLINVFSAR